VVVTAASVPEREASKQVLSDAVYQMGQRVSRLYLIWVDRGDSGHRFLKWAMDCLGWMIQVVLRPQQTQGFVLLKKRSVVEQTFGWLNWYRRLRKDDRRLPACSQPLIYISLIQLMVLVSLSEDYNQENLLKPNCRIWIKPVLLDLPLMVSMNIAVIIEICFQMLEVLRPLSIYI
jgi:transposase